MLSIPFPITTILATIQIRFAHTKFIINLTFLCVSWNTFINSFIPAMCCHSISSQRKRHVFNWYSKIEQNVRYKLKMDFRKYNGNDNFNPFRVSELINYSIISNICTNGENIQSLFVTVN